MPYLADQRPYLILGWALKEFLKGRVRPRERKLKQTEFNCLACKAQRAPLGMMADYIVITEKTALLKGLRSICGCACSRIVSARQRGHLAQTFDLHISNAKDG